MKYNHKKIEKKWQTKWNKEAVYEPDLKNAKKPFYNLMMFPYPSAEGLHVGNMYAFTGADVYGRFMRMQGNDVFEPIGLDGFGIHSENYAIKTGTHPKDKAKISEKKFYKQLQASGNGFAWKEKLETYDPEYYKWTQWIFVQMFKKGLVYRKKSPVNWCPSCMTVLADEQVESGFCERCGSEVVQKELAQWFFKITDYAERLLKDLEGLDWSEKVKTAQKNWIGKSKGVEIDFKMVIETEPEALKKSLNKVTVFTTRPDTLFGATYLVFAPENQLIEDYKPHILNYKEVKSYIDKAKKKTDIERVAEGKEKTGMEIKGIKAVNPATGEKIPIWTADYVLNNVGTGAIMAVPAHDERDFEFAKKFNLKTVKVINPPQITPPQVPGYGGPEISVISECWTGKGKLIHSGKFTDVDSEEAGKKITEFVKGRWTVRYRLRDWLISRQRYWGPPIPLIFCETCESRVKNRKPKDKKQALSRGEIENPGWTAVPEKDLPVKLPYFKDFRPTGTDKSPLATVEEFYKTKCPNCGGEATRETDVSDTFLDSAWYYYRYPSVNLESSELKTENSKIKIPWNSEATERWLPVDMYIGGAEHSVLHLLYTRFITKVFHDWGLVNFKEPFKKFRAHGLLIKEGAKMSKSKENIVNPDEYIDKFGADVLRTYLMFLAPFEQGGDFRDESVMGIVRFLDRVWTFTNGVNFSKTTESAKKNLKETRREINKEIHQAIKKTTEDLEKLKYNTAISELMILLDVLIRKSHAVAKEDLEIFLKLLAPFAPHITEEIWREILGKKESIHISSWPEYNPKLIKEKTFLLVVQVNGKVRDTIEAKKGISEKEAERLARESEKAGRHLKKSGIKKIVFIEDKLINFVVKK